MAPFHRRDVTLESQIAFISELRDMLLSGRFWNGILIKGIFIPVEISFKTQISAVKDVHIGR
jgi:hypothetical protein